jgi:DNA modification methylase
MESSLDDIDEDAQRDYGAENILKDDYKVFFDTCESMPEIPDNTVHFWFTSPPYATMRGTMAYPSYKAYLGTMFDILKEMYRTLRPGRVMMINISDYQISAQLDEEVIKGTTFKLGEKYDCPSHFSYLLYKLNQEFAEHYELKYEDTIIWKKSGSTSQRAGTFVQSGNPLKYRPEEVTERILVFRKGEIDYERIWKEKRRSDVYSDVDISTYDKFKNWVSVDPEKFRKYMQNVWEISPETSSDHPAPFPLELPKVATQLYSLPREIVGDPFLGSATTIRAAQETERVAVGYENFDAEDGDGDDFRNMIMDRIGANSANLGEFM